MLIQGPRKGVKARNPATNPATIGVREAIMAKRNIQAAASTPSTAESLFREGVRRWGLGDRGGAVARIDASLALELGSPATLSMAAYMLAEMGKPDAAMVFFRRALDTDPSHRVAWSNLGKLFFALRRYQ